MSQKNQEAGLSTSLCYAQDGAPIFSRLIEKGGSEMPAARQPGLTINASESW
jgi:hypothetical protein